MNKAMLVMVVSLFVAITVMAEIKPVGTIVPQFCGDNVAYLPFNPGRYVERVCLSSIEDMRFLIISFSDGSREYLFEMKREEKPTFLYRSMVEYELSVLRIGNDLEYPSYVTARKATIKEVKDFSVRKLCQIVELSGETPTNEPFLVTDFALMATTLSM